MVMCLCHIAYAVKHSLRFARCLLCYEQQLSYIYSWRAMPEQQKMYSVVSELVKKTKTPLILKKNIITVTVKS